MQTDREIDRCPPIDGFGPEFDADLQLLHSIHLAHFVFELSCSDVPERTDRDSTFTNSVQNAVRIYNYGVKNRKPNFIYLTKMFFFRTLGGVKPLDSSKSGD
ncbi:hypothetical protein AVEN_106425-1 [Araneus ventricosus]|uniref:Uncharacterized protein n=1 Tax=Araneus ventricosus TaxID=182803 RepID=A0A4Y2AT57_ARAVE|nr:hypothetical protein AVEN_106425-1 [Araneus ventricosus]